MQLGTEVSDRSLISSFSPCRYDFSALLSHKALYTERAQDFKEERLDGYD